MGCDIHMVIQRKDENGKWYVFADEEDYGINRQYLLFGWLAGVRNKNITPLQERRGFPEDLVLDNDCAYPFIGGKCMGEFGFGWLHISEILDVKCPDEDLQWFVDVMESIKGTYGPDVRLVFGFDN